MGWLATHHELDCFITFNHNCFYRFNLRRAKFQTFLEACPSPHSKSTLSVVSTLATKLGQHSINPHIFVVMPGKAHNDTKDPT